MTPLAFLSSSVSRILAVIALVAASGCTTSSNIAAQLQVAAEEETALPDETNAVPQARDDGFVLSSYAGGTPSVGAPEGRFASVGVAARSPELDRLIAHYARHYDVPERLVRRVVKRESTFNPQARNGPYWGLMQILPATARTMGHTGSAEDLLDAETNLKYAVRYLRGAYLTADGDEDRAVGFYARGYYYDAKAKGLLDETGLGKDRRRMR